MAELIDDYEVPETGTMGALRTFLLMHKPIVDMFDPEYPRDIYVDGIRKDRIRKMPINCINLVSGGGPEDGSEAPRDDTRVYVCCYGKDSIDAERLDMAVLIPLKRLRGAVIGREVEKDEDGNCVVVTSGIYIHWAKPGGKSPGVDPVTDWPYIRRSYLICFGWEVG